MKNLNETCPGLYTQFHEPHWPENDVVEIMLAFPDRHTARIEITHPEFATAEDALEAGAIFGPYIRNGMRHAVSLGFLEGDTALDVFVVCNGDEPDLLSMTVLSVDNAFIREPGHA